MRTHLRFAWFPRLQRLGNTNTSAMCTSWEHMCTEWEHMCTQTVHKTAPLEPAFAHWEGRP